MKRKKVLFVLLFVVGFTLMNAQRSNGSLAIQAQGGIMGEGYIGSLGFSYNAGNKGVLIEANLLYQNYEVEYISQLLPYKVYGLDLKFGYSLEKDKLYPFYFQIKGGGFAGLQDFNKGKNTEPIYNSELPHPVDGFIYGVVINPEMEIVIYRRASIIIGFSQYWNLVSKYSKSNYAVTAGLKYYF